MPGYLLSVEFSVDVFSKGEEKKGNVEGTHSPSPVKAQHACMW